jgi:potassium-transporting ATPase KdpC subunit
MLKHLKPAFIMVVLFTVLTGLVYPLAITGVAQIAMRAKANGSLIRQGLTVVGSELIGQSFTSDGYFHGRPSATSAPDPKDDTKTVDAPYNGDNSSGSNLGPTSKKLLERVAGDVDGLKKAGASTIPADAVTASGSGLDPHISPAFAELQIARVAAARGVDAAKVKAVVDTHISRSLFGVIGEPTVNVLDLNLALDAALGRSTG